MKQVVRNRPLRLLFAANFVSMIGSGMNSAAVIWYILQATHSEQILGALVVAQAIPSLLLMPFSGVVIDREDRRRLIMLLDGIRGAVILVVAILCFRHAVQVWQLFAMSVLVSTGFWMFWPTINALIQELTPDTQFAESNGWLMAGVQSGWVIAGALVGFAYNKIGLGGILLLDFCTYVFSIACYLGVRKGRHVVAHHVVSSASAVRKFWHEMRDGFRFVVERFPLAMIGLTWALFVSSMMVTGVVTAPISDRIVHRGAVGYGWMNAGWGVGAAISSLAAARVLKHWGWRMVIPSCMLLLAAAFYAVPFSSVILVAALLYFVGGIARGTVGVALNAGIMTAVPKHYMGRVQNLFSMFAITVQVTMAPLVGRVAQQRSLTLAVAIIATLYIVGFGAALLAGRTEVAESQVQSAD